MKLFVISAWNKAIRGVARARNIAIQPGKIGIPFGHLIDKPGQDTLDAPSWLYGVIWRAKEPIGMLPASTATIPALPIPLHFVAEKRPRAFVLFQHRLDRRVFGQFLNIERTHSLFTFLWRLIQRGRQRRNDITPIFEITGIPFFDRRVLYRLQASPKRNIFLRWAEALSETFHLIFNGTHNFTSLFSKV